MIQKTYQIIKDEEKLRDFINWMPELKNNETIYIALFARKKYCADVKYIKTDKAQCARFTSHTKYLFDKIRQLECPVGSYIIKDIVIPQEALSLYISINPRDMLLATKSSLIKLAQLITQEYNGYNPHQEVMSEIQRACGRKLFRDFDFDKVDLDYTLGEIKKHLNEDCINILKTKNGFHLLVELGLIDKSVEKTWYKNIISLEGIDLEKERDPERRSDALIPVPGCVQGDFIPYFI